MKFICCSSTWAEIANTHETGTEIKWQRLVLEELGDPETGPSLMWGDNYPHILGCYNQNTNHSALKSIDTKHKWAWEQIRAGVLIAAHLTRMRMIADMGTKQEAVQVWLAQKRVWIGESFIPELVGVKLGMQPTKLKAYQLNTNDQSTDPTLKYLLACDRHDLKHDIDVRLPQTIQNMYKPDAATDFVGATMSNEGRMSILFHDERFVAMADMGQDPMEEMMSLSEEMGRMTLRAQHIMNRTRNIDTETTQARILRFDTDRQFERMRLMEDEVSMHEENVRRRILIENGVVASPQWSRSSDDGQELIMGPDNSLFEDEYENQMSEEENMIEQKHEMIEEKHNVIEEKQENKRRERKRSVEIESVKDECLVMVSRTNFIHHVECGSIKKPSECQYMTMMEARGEYKFPVACCNRKFLAHLK